MSNFRVRQVLALRLPDRQNRFMVALATWMGDDSRIVRVGVATLIEESGSSHNTVSKARRELETAGKLKSQGGRGRGNLTLWTALCLPEKGTSDVGPFNGESKGTSDVGPFTPVDNSPKGTNREPEKVPNEARKRYQGQVADQQEQNMGFNPRANTLGSLSLRAREDGGSEARDERDDIIIEGKITKPGAATPLAGRIAAAAGCTTENAEAFIRHMRRKPNVRSATALLDTAIRNGTIADLYAEESAAAAAIAELFSTRRSATPPQPSPEPEDTPKPPSVAFEPPEPPWKQVECPVCKAPPTRFCVNPATGGTAATHHERKLAAGKQMPEEATQ